MNTNNNKFKIDIKRVKIFDKQTSFKKIETF